MPDKSAISPEISRSDICVRVLIMSALILLLWYFLGTPLQTLGSIMVSIILVISIAWGIGGVFFYKAGTPNYQIFIAILLVTAVCAPILSAFRANLYFGQPWFYGLLSERHWWGIAFGPIIYYLVTSGRVTAKNLEMALVWLAWASLIAFSVLTVLYLMYPEWGEEQFYITAVSATEGRGLRAKFRLYAIVFGAMYYLAQATTHKPFVNFLKSGLFIFYIVFVARGRVDMVCLALAVTFVIVTSGLYTRWRWIALIAVLYGVLGAMIPQYGYPDLAASPSTAHSDETSSPDTLAARSIADLTSIVEGKRGNDLGLNARSESFQEITGRLIGSPELLLFGAGRVSNKWQGGFSGVIGMWFYPPELGFLGAIFVYGLLLYIAAIAYSLFLARAVFKATSKMESAFVTAMRWVLVYLIIKFIAGMPLFYPFQFFFTAFVCLALSPTNKIDNINVKPVSSYDKAV